MKFRFHRIFGRAAVIVRAIPQYVGYPFRRFYGMHNMCVWYLFLFALFVFTTGCDPIGVRRVQLNLANCGPQNTSISVEASDTQHALGILDTTLIQNGYVRETQSQPGYKRVYSLPIEFEGKTFRIIPCRVDMTATGIEVFFGDIGFLGSYSQAEPAFVSVRDAFIKAYGKKRVRSHRFGTRF